MTEPQETSKPMTAQPRKPDADAVTPDALMGNFKGSGFIPITLFTIIVHVVAIAAFSVPYLMKTLRGADTSKLSEKERIDIAVLEASESLRVIAQKHGLNPQDISGRFVGGGARPASAKNEAPKNAAPGATTPTAPGATTSPATSPTTSPSSPSPEPVKPKSSIEKELEAKATGPKLPGIDEKDELFK